MAQSRSTYIYLTLNWSLSFFFSQAKIEQIPIEIDALRCEQNKLLQQLKQNTIAPSSSIDNNGLKKQIDELGKKIEQLGDEEKNLRRLIRKKNMR